MSKWFFVQFLLVTIFAAFLGHASVLPRYLDLWSPYMQKVEKHRGEGVIRMLGDELNGLEFVQQKQLIQQLQPQFGYTISLTPLSALTLNEVQLTHLSAGQVVFNEPSFQLILGLADPTLTIIIENMEVPSIQFDLPVKINLNSTVEILAQALKSRPQTTWQSILDKMTSQHQVPLAIVANELLNLAIDDQRQLRMSGILYIQSLESNSQSLPANIVYRQIEGTEYTLKIGPLMPVINRVMQQIRLSSIASIVLLVLLPLLLWIYPTWLSAKSLQHASKDFAIKGLNNRAAIFFASHLNSLAQLFNQMAAKIAFLDSRNTLLTSAVSHDLRTPISAMEFSLALLHSSDNLQDRKRHLNSLERNFDTLKTLSIQLETYAKFDRHEVQLVKKSILIADWLTTHLATYQGTDELSLHLYKPLNKSYIQVDPDYLARAMDNLLTNNLRFASSLVRVSLRAADNLKYCEIIVENDGLAIAEEDRHRVLEPFIRLDENRSQNSEGSGLGLAIVQRIMRWHQGDVKVEKSDLGGAKFILTLPIHRN